MGSLENVALFGIGSTNFRSAVGDPDGGFLTDIHVEPTRVETLPAQALERLERLADEVGGIDAVSIACGGPVADGIVREMTGPDGTTARDIGLEAAIAEAYDCPVRLENDCTAAALAEWTFGAGREHDSDCVVHLTMGTGIGAGVVDKGRVVRGASGHATEVGFLPVGPPERESCGVPGAWEAYCSGRGIAEYVREQLGTESRPTALPAPDQVTAPDVFAAASDGDPVANDYLDRLCEYNAAGIGAVCNAYNPDLLTIGGGVGRSNFETILERTRPHLERYTVVDRPTIEPTKLGDEIGLYGALAPYRTQARSTVSATADPRGSSRAP